MTTSSRRASCTGHESVVREKKFGSETIVSTQRIMPTETTGNLMDPFEKGFLLQKRF